MTTPVAGTTDAELFEVVCRAIEKAGVPLTSTKVRSNLPKALTRPQAQITKLLEEYVASGRLFRYAKGKSVTFGLEAPSEVAKRAVLDALGDEPTSWKDLKKHPALEAATARVGAKPLEAARDALKLERRLFEWPKVGKTARYARRPIDATEFLSQKGFVERAIKAMEGALGKDLATLTKLGLLERDVRAVAMELLAQRLGLGTRPASAGPEPETSADVPSVPVPYPPDMATLFLDRMIDEDPAAAGGAPVSLRSLRRALAFQFPEKASFDEAVMALAREGVMALHRYDYPAELSDEGRDELVADGRGGFYLAISRRS